MSRAGVSGVGFSKFTVRRAAALMSAGRLSALATGALEQSTPQATTTTTASQPAQLQEVIVTANRSGAESAQKVAIPLSVVSPTLVDRSGLGNLSELSNF